VAVACHQGIYSPTKLQGITLRDNDNTRRKIQRTGTFSYLTFHRILCILKTNKRFNHKKPMNKRTVPVIFTTSFGLLFGPVGTFSILRKVSMPSMTLPKTTCFPSRKSQGAVTKNYLSAVKKGEGGGQGGIDRKTRLTPFVLGPELAYLE
jgi:hypothetical protein